MKRRLLTLLVALVGLTASAQSLLVGDADQDGELSIADVTKTVNMVVGREAQSAIDMGALAYKVDNSMLAGTWYLDDMPVTFNADGTTSYAGASTYKFRPWKGTLILNDANGAVVKIFEVLDIADDALVLRENGGSIVDFSKNLIEDGHIYVDLDLPSGTMWAACNIGATNPEDYGDYFAWGETTTTSTYNWSTYTLCNGSSTTMTKYCNNSSYGTVDNKTELELADDAAYVNWGSNWRIPSIDQFEELINSSYTTTEWTTQNGIDGRKITSISNGNSIFLPAAGFRLETSLYNEDSYGGYWSRTLYTSYPNYASHLYLNSNNIGSTYNYRCNGRTVRPVRNQ